MAGLVLKDTRQVEQGSGNNFQSFPMMASLNESEKQMQSPDIGNAIKHRESAGTREKCQQHLVPSQDGSLCQYLEDGWRDLPSAFALREELVLCLWEVDLFP